MKQPPGFTIGNKVCKLKRSLYGLKQSARQWNIEIDKVLKESGCTQSQSDMCLYTFKSNGKSGFVIIHVDDFLITGDESVVTKLSENIGNKFILKDLGEVSEFLAIRVTKKDRNYYVDQTKYIERIIEEANRTDAKPSKMPMDTGYHKLYSSIEKADQDQYQKLIGMLLYVAVNSRPDMAASVSILSQRQSKPTREKQTNKNRYE